MKIEINMETWVGIAGLIGLILGACIISTINVENMGYDTISMGVGSVS